MIRTINGEGRPRIVVMYNDDSTATIDLPFCKVLTEAAQVLDQVVELIDYSQEPDEIGYRYGAVLDYSSWMRGDKYALLQPLLVSDKKEVWLTPRIDFPLRKFKVWLVNKGEVSLKARGGHQGVRLQFVGLDVLPSDPLISTIDAPVAVDDDTRIVDDALTTIFGW